MDTSPSSAPPPARTSFGPTTGFATGVLGLLVCALFVVLTLLTDRTLDGLRIVLGLLVVAVLIWCYLVRPRVVLRPDDVELRNAFTDHFVPYAGINDVSIRSVTRVYAGPRTVVGIGMGVSTRKLVRARSTGATGGFAGLWGGRSGPAPKADPSPDPARPITRLSNDALPQYVTEQILARAGAARSDLGEGDQPRPRRRVAVRELTALAVLVVAFVVALLV